jgi:hypothetical protein
MKKIITLVLCFLVFLPQLQASDQKIIGGLFIPPLSYLPEQFSQKAVKHFLSEAKKKQLNTKLAALNTGLQPDDSSFEHIIHLIRQGADPDFSEALHHAIVWDKQDFIKTFFALGGSPHKKFLDARSHLISAAHVHRNSAIVTLLLDAKADPNDGDLCMEGSSLKYSFPTRVLVEHRPAVLGHYVVVGQQEITIAQAIGTKLLLTGADVCPEYTTAAKPILKKLNKEFNQKRKFFSETVPTLQTALQEHIRVTTLRTIIIDFLMPSTLEEHRKYQADMRKEDREKWNLQYRSKW